MSIITIIPKVEVTTAYEYELDEPQLVEGYGPSPVLVSRVRVTIEDLADEPYVQVRVLAVSAKKDGTPKASASRGWTYVSHTWTYPFEADARLRHGIRGGTL